MLKTRFSSWSTRSGLLALMLVAACSETGKDPLDLTSPTTLKPNFVLVPVEARWDFVGLLNAGPGCHEWGSSETISQAGFGSIVASATGANVTSKGQELVPGDDTERGLGLDLDLAAGCNFGSEVGEISPLTDPYNAFLFLDLNGVLPAGSVLTEIELGSVQTTEGWLIYYSTTGIGGPYILLSQGEGNGSNNTPPDGDVFISVASLPTANLVLRFDRNDAASGQGTTGNDYTVKAVTTEGEIDTGPSGCTLTQGYWKTHSALGPAPSDPAWLNIGAAGQNTLFFNTGLSWYTIFHMPPSGGNGFLILAHQYMAAKLNILNGASSTPAVDAAITAAETYFSGKGAGVTSESDKTINNQLKALASTLESFNSGATGPGHCDDLEELPS
jgi:hypothetical protein